jgi:hypothetical protein
MKSMMMKGKQAKVLFPGSPAFSAVEKFNCPEVSVLLKVSCQ